MKTLVHLNEWTQIVLKESIDDIDKLIKVEHDTWANFIKVHADFADHTDGQVQKIDKVIRLYMKRILFYFEK